MILSSEIYNQIMKYCFTGHSLPIANEKEFIKLIYIYHSNGYNALVYQLANIFWNNRNHKNIISCKLYIPKYIIKTIHILVNDISKILKKNYINRELSVCLLDNKLDRGKIIIILDIPNKVDIPNSKVDIPNNPILSLSNIPEGHITNLVKLTLNNTFYQKIFDKCDLNTQQLSIIPHYYHKFNQWSITFIRFYLSQLESIWINIIFLEKYSLLDNGYIMSQLGNFRDFKQTIIKQLSKNYKWFLENNYKIVYPIFKKRMYERLTYLAKIEGKSQRHKLALYIKNETDIGKWLIFAII